MDTRDDHRNRQNDEDGLESPLGIAGTPISPDAPDHLRASDDEDEVRRRRRALSADQEERRSSLMDDVNLDHKGATGSDLGAHRGRK